MVSPFLLEYDYGEYEGLTGEQIRARRPDWQLFRDGCPGGETPAAVRRRAQRFVELALARNGDVAAFAHAHILKAVAVAFLDWVIGAGDQLGNLGPGGMALLADEGRGRQLAAWDLG